MQVNNSIQAANQEISSIESIDNKWQFFIYFKKREKQMIK